MDTVKELIVVSDLVVWRSCLREDDDIEKEDSIALVVDSSTSCK